MIWLPTVRVEVLKLAVVLPPLVLRVPCPMLVAPSENVTTPVGLAAPAVPGALTVTVVVNVTDWPDTEGFPDATTTMLVLALPTVCVSVPVLLRKLLSPA
jgi:hypothetical protein